MEGFNFTKWRQVNSAAYIKVNGIWLQDWRVRLNRKGTRAVGEERQKRAQAATVNNEKKLETRTVR